MSLTYKTGSFTSVVGKLVERLIRDHMVEYLVKYKLIWRNDYLEGYNMNITFQVCGSWCVIMG